MVYQIELIRYPRKFKKKSDDGRELFLSRCVAMS